MAQNGTQSYQSFTVTIGGHLFTGFARGNSYSAVYDESQFEKLVGNRGLGAWVRRISLSATITMELMTASNDNDVLSNAWTADFYRTNGFGMPLVVKDANSATVQTAELVRVEKLPDESRGDTVNTRVWTLGTTKLVTYLGGLLPPLIGDAEQARQIAESIRQRSIAI